MDEFSTMLARARALAQAAAEKRPNDPVYETLGRALTAVEAESDPGARADAVRSLGRWIVRELDGGEAILPEDREIVAAVVRMRALVDRSIPN